MSRSIVAAPAHRPREFWKHLVHRWQASDESQQAVADAAGVSVNTLRYWVAKLRTEPSAKLSDFVEVVRTPAAQPATGTCRVRVGSSVVLELDRLPPAEWVRSLSEGR